jgi:beta-glucanase (GH16 family)
VRNKEAQFYTVGRTENAVVRDGCLVLTARKEAWQGSEYTSASLNTRGKFEFTYGAVEVRFKVPKGRGVWPGVWMLGANRGAVPWPLCGEIDLMEYVGWNPDILHFTVHTQAFNHRAKNALSSKITVPEPWADFHTTRLDWTKDALVISLDGKPVRDYRNAGQGREQWPFDQPQYLLLNLAVGGSWGGQKGIDDSALPAELLIDYVRVYAPAE